MELIEKLMKLNILYVREMERKGFIKVTSMGQLTEPLGTHSQSLTIGKAVNYLKDNIIKNSSIEYLLSEIVKLQEEVSISPIKDYKFWRSGLNEAEEKLDTLAVNRLFYMDTPYVSITTASEELDVTESAIKQACQQERLLNTRKLGKTWLVHMPECRAYWNKPNSNENRLYKNFEY